MHESALCTEIVDIVLEEAKRADAISVDEVELVVGEARDIVEELFTGFFGFLVRGTIAQDARLVFRRVPVAAQCGSCNEVFPIDLRSCGTQRAACPQCGSDNYDVRTGFELFVASIDVVTKEEAQALGK